MLLPLQYLADFYGHEDAGEELVLFESLEAYLETRRLADQRKRREAIKRIHARRLHCYSEVVLADILTSAEEVQAIEEFRCAVQRF
jgi:hypothetical protein